MDGWQVLRLAAALREAYLPLSTQDIADAFAYLRRFRSLPPKTLLRTAFVHRPQDLALFELAWDTLFNPRRDESAPVQLPYRRDSGNGPGGFGTSAGNGGVSLLAQGNAILAQTPRLSPLLATDPSETYLARDEEFERALKQALGEMGYYWWLNSVELAYQHGSLGEADWQECQELGIAILNKARRELLAQSIDRTNSWEPLARQHWRYKALNNLSPDEKRLVQTAIKQLGKQLAVRPGWRWNSSKRGVFDLEGSIREACRGDGQIFKLTYRRRQPRVPELVLLCDVSNSVAPYAEFLLFLVGRIRTRFRRVRLFFFIDSIWDVSSHIWDEEPDDCKDLITSWGRPASSGFSDYGQVFREFSVETLPNLSSRATLVILGDGKNNFRPPHAEYLAQISERVRHVFWLNPLPESEWQARDNALPFYSSYCTRVYRCRTAADLQRIARHLL